MDTIDLSKLLTTLKDLPESSLDGTSKLFRQKMILSGLEKIGKLTLRQVLDITDEMTGQNNNIKLYVLVPGQEKPIRIYEILSDEELSLFLKNITSGKGELEAYQTMRETYPPQNKFR